MLLTPSPGGQVRGPGLTVYIRDVPDTVCNLSCHSLWGCCESRLVLLLQPLYGARRSRSPSAAVDRDCLGY